LDQQTIVQIIQALIFVLVGGLIIALYLGWREIQLANRIPFYQLRRQRIARGWRLLFFGILLVVMALILQIVNRGAVAMLPIEALPSPSMTASDAESPSTPAIAATDGGATATHEPTSTPSGPPALPEVIREQLDEFITPDPRAAVGLLHVAKEVVYPAYPDDEVLESVEGVLYGLFNYDHLDEGVLWTAVWMKDWEIICLESNAWEGEYGGWGYTECEMAQWPAGSYLIHIFLGEDWKVTTQFTVLESAQAPSDSATSTSIPSP
jgi:hypothetical protein